MLAVKHFRVVVLVIWLVAALWMAGTALAQDGGNEPPDVAVSDSAPQDLDDIAVKLTPLLVGAALIERTLEFLFNWVERAILDASHTLHLLTVRVSGLVQVDLYSAWQNVAKLSEAAAKRQGDPNVVLAANPESLDPNDWPLAMLEERIAEARKMLAKAEAAIETAMDSPLYVARKKVTATVLSIGFGVLLAVVGSLRLFEPLGVEVADWIDGPFSVFDMVLAGVLMGLGTDWVHQVIGLLVNGKGLLGRAATGRQLEVADVESLASMAVEQQMGRQLDVLRSALVTAEPSTSTRSTSESARSAAAADSAAMAESAPAADPADAIEQELAEAIKEAPDLESSAGVRLASASLGGTAADPEAEPEADARESTTAAAPEGFLPLDEVSVTVREGGTAARAEPSVEGTTLGTLPEGTRHDTDGVVFGQYSWLRTPYERPEDDDQNAWIAGEDTDFPRSSAYNQVDGQWYETDAVLAFRRQLVQDLLRVSGGTRDQIASVSTLAGEALEALETRLTAETIPARVSEFRSMQLHLGLPDPFDYLPVQSTPPAGVEDMGFSGFGPTSYALENWRFEYEGSRGMHPGVDYLVPEGTPVIAVADGVIVPFSFLDDPASVSLALRPYLPEQYRLSDDERVLSNVLIAYGYLAPGQNGVLVKEGQEVRAGDILGSSGWPVLTREDGSTIQQRNNAHLHVEAHFVTDGYEPLGARTPLNPLLFFSPRLVAWQARIAAQHGGTPYPSSGQPFGRLGFFSVGAFSYEPADSIVWQHEVTRAQPWPEGVYTLDGLVEWTRGFEPYPLDASAVP